MARAAEEVVASMAGRAAEKTDAEEFIRCNEVSSTESEIRYIDVEAPDESKRQPSQRRSPPRLPDHSPLNR